MGLRMLDLYCGGGGAAMGYSRAGIPDITGVDINKQPRYPFQFIQGDALEYLSAHWQEYDIIHASPPCQAYTRKQTDWGRKRTHWTDHPDLLGPTRDMLLATGLPFVIENVVGAPIRPDIMLCGTMFGLRISKHRLFESNYRLYPPDRLCGHSDIYNPWKGEGRSADAMREAMGIDWLPTSGGASRKRGDTGDLYNAIPPAYTEFIGRILLESIGHGEKAHTLIQTSIWGDDPP